LGPLKKKKKSGGPAQWCIAKNEGGYTQKGVAKGLKVPCLVMITEVSIRCQKNPEVGIRRIPAYTPPQYTTGPCAGAQCAHWLTSAAWSASRDAIKEHSDHVSSMAAVVTAERSACLCLCVCVRRLDTSLKPIN